MTISHAWEHASFSDRLAVYQDYLDSDDFGFEKSSFEEFDAACRFSTFEGIRRLYKKSE